MMGLRIVCLGVGILAGSSALAQTPFQDAERTGREQLFEQRGPFAGLTEFTYLRRTWSVNTFYTVFRGQGPGQTWFWVARRATGGPDQTEAVVWADSRTCPGVESALLAMERLPVVRPDAPRLGREPETLGIVMDGTRHTFWNRWARSGPDDTTVGLEITGNVDSPIAIWWANAAEELAPCWRAEVPG